MFSRDEFQLRLRKIYPDCTDHRAKHLIINLQTLQLIRNFSAFKTDI